MDLLTVTNSLCLALHGVLKIYKYAGKCGVTICFEKNDGGDDDGWW